jgi:PAS domain S-box-containing protein
MNKRTYYSLQTHWTLLLLFFFLSPPLSSQEYSVKTIEVGILDNFPPQYSLHESGEPTGFAIDVIEYFAHEYDFSIDYKVYNSWAKLFEALEKEEIDLIPNIGITERRMDNFVFSCPVETFPVSIFTRSSISPLPNLESLKGKTVAVVSLNIGEMIIKDASPGKIVTYDNVQEALFGLISGNVDALIYPEPVLRKIARQAKIEDRGKGDDPPLRERKRAMSVIKKNKELLDWLDPKIQAFLKTAEYSNIYATWYGEPEPFWTIRKVLIIMSLLLINTILFLLYWKYRTTEKLVSLRTEQLSHKAQLLNQVNDGVISLDLENRIISVNPGAEELFIFEKNELLGKDLPSLTDLNSEKPIPMEPPCHREIVIHRKDGTTLEASLSLSPLFNEDNNKIGYVCLIQDVSERKALEAKREKLIQELQAALTQIRTLNGLLPICAHCKKIRDDKGYWNQLESYLSEHSDIVFSHGLCPDCMEELYGDIK